MGFVLVTALWAALVHTLALSQFIPLWLLRLFGWSLAALGILKLSGIRGATGTWWGRLSRSGLSRFEYVGVALVLLTLLGLGGAVMGPPTDADSLDYHLGVPLDWIRHGGAWKEAVRQGAPPTGPIGREPPHPTYRQGAATRSRFPVPLTAPTAARPGRSGRAAAGWFRAVAPASVRFAG